MPNPHPKLVKGSRRAIPAQPQRPIKRVIAYIRISKDRETQTSIETQEYEIAQFCKAKRWQIVKTLADPGRSAYKKNVRRPEYDEALEIIERGQADAIVVYKLDRFSRSVADFWDTFQAIIKAGGHFVSVAEAFIDSSNDLANAMLFFVATFAQMESQMKADRAIPMHANQQRKGLVPGGPRPYGYTKVNSADNDGKGARLEICEKEADLIRMAAVHVIKGGSIRGFINQFQPTSSLASKAMTHRGLRRTLLSPTIIGCRVHNGELVQAKKEDGGWDPIISREQWYEIKRAIDGEERKRTGFRPDICHLLTAGLIVCGKCGKSLGTRNWVNKTTREVTMRYLCRDCGPSIDMDIADQIVTAKLFETVTQEVWSSWQTAGMGWDISVLAEIEQAMAMVDKKYHDGKMSMQRWVDNMGTLEAKMEAAQNQEPMDIPAAQSLIDSWEDFDLEDKRRVLSHAFDKIELMPLSLSRDPKRRIQFNGEPS